MHRIRFRKVTLRLHLCNRTDKTTKMALIGITVFNEVERIRWMRQLTMFQTNINGQKVVQRRSNDGFASFCRWSSNGKFIYSQTVEDRNMDRTFTTPENNRFSPVRLFLRRINHFEPKWVKRSLLYPHVNRTELFVFVLASVQKCPRCVIEPPNFGRLNRIDNKTQGSSRAKRGLIDIKCHVSHSYQLNDVTFIIKPNGRDERATTLQRHVLFDRGNDAQNVFSVSRGCLIHDVTALRYISAANGHLNLDAIGMKSRSVEGKSHDPCANFPHERAKNIKEKGLHYI
ncbi:hypothetical protein TcasGA2_TC010643 [Tribolium castaneum]|uniref:Uncharacterized protein n=1 Tax=Tribolium castaneum TaxID=7070 RepID=D6X2K5_TRICA|nr:hypothetical protein TcasGA2_TC010643 [Tribolium castaneum]